MKTKLSPKDQIALDDLVHEVMTSIASRINNQGVAAQIEFLKAQGFSEDDIEKEIKEGLE